MTKYEIAILVCRALGIYCFISALNSLQSLVFGVGRFLQPLSVSSGVRFSNGANPFWTFVTSSVPSALLVLFGIALWLGAPILARWMLRAPQPKIDDPIVISPMVAPEIMETLKSASLWFLGVLSVVQGFPQVVMASFRWLEMSKQLAITGGKAVNTSLYSYSLPQLALGLTQIVLGVGLLLLSRSVSRRVLPPAQRVLPVAPETSLPS